MPIALKAWLIAFRLPTLLIPTIQVATGTGIAYAIHGNVNLLLAFYAWLVAVAITIGTNLINDAIDFAKGGDPLNRFGMPKVINAGWLTQSQVYWGGMVALLIACMVPFLLPEDRFICFCFVLVSAVCGYCYTGGPFPISYLGLSEIFIFIFYGGVCVIVPYYAQTYQMTVSIILAAMQMGMLAILPNALNNFRDVAEDAAVNKHTLAVRFGRNFARWELAVLTIVPFVLGLAWIALGHAAAALLPLTLLPLAYFFVKSIWINQTGKILNAFFGLSVFIHFFFGILLIMGMMIK